jgi:UDP-N-acetylmuramate dehydrogenase
MPRLELPNIRGTYRDNEPLGASSWFGCGGAADIVFQPYDQEDLADFLRQYPADAPLHILGGMSNVIIRDGGLDGVTIRLGKAFAKVQVDGVTVQAGAAALDGTVASAAANHGLEGLAFLSGVPGMIGGAIRMNAGAYGREVKDAIMHVTALDRSGNIINLNRDQLDMRYRHCGAGKDLIFVEAFFEGTRGSVEAVKAHMQEIKAKRNTTQPIRALTGGSTFANPAAEELEKAGLPEGTKAWQLVERVGGRGLRIGGAMMSELHCNFMINTGSASAADLEALGEELCRRVREETGITLHWEIKRIGRT